MAMRSDDEMRCKSERSIDRPTTHAKSNVRAALKKFLFALASYNSSMGNAAHIHWRFAFGNRRFRCCYSMLIIIIIIIM